MSKRKVSISGRIDPNNYEWLKRVGERTERSMNYILNRTLTQARQADNKRSGGGNESKR